MELESLYETLGLNLKNNNFPIEDVFSKVQEHMQLVWKKLQETVKKKLNQELKNSILWKQRLTLEQSRKEHEKTKDEDSLIEYIKSIDQFVQKWFLSDSTEAKNESQKLNQVFSEFAMKTEEIGNQLCSIMQKSLSDYCKEIKIDNMSSLLTHLKTEQLIISNTYDFSLSKKETGFFTETFDPKKFYYMLDLMSQKKGEREMNPMNGHFNSKFSTFSRQNISKSKHKMDSYSDPQSQLDPNIHFQRENNPFIKNSLSDNSSSNKNEVRHSLPATGQWEGHAQPLYNTEVIKTKNEEFNRKFNGSNDQIKIHKSENISLIDHSQSKNLNRAVHSEFNNSFSHK
jgi:hypothetical protein